MLMLVILPIGIVLVSFLLILSRIFMIERKHQAFLRSCPPPKSPPPPPDPMMKIRREARLRAQYELELEKARKDLRAREQQEAGPEQ